MKHFLTAVILFCLMTLGASDAFAQVKVIVHMDVTTDAIENDALERIYLGKLSRWPDNSKIIPVMLKQGDTHETFVSDLLHSNTVRFMTFWRQAVFTGRGIPPKSFDSEKELMIYVSKTPGAIGYIDISTPLNGVKTLHLK